jgi:para-aminobenzoate synthetase component 1
METNFASKVNALALAKEPFFFIIDFAMEKPLVYAQNELPQGIHFSLSDHRFNCAEEKLTQPGFVFKTHPPTFGNYQFAFDKVMHEIKIGNSYLLNLTFQTKIETNLTLSEIYNYSKAKYKLLFKDQFVVFSPETFVQIRNGIISSYPMKGTIDAQLPDAAELLLGDAKESAEHHTIVDLIRNDIAMVANDVRVERFKYLEKIITHHGELLQMSSEIKGILPANYREQLGDILLRLLPAGSISGAPKHKTLKIISSTENYQRGYYTGIFGYFDGENLDSAVMIRFIEKQGDALWFKSGGGITAMSQVEAEYEELKQKIYVPLARNY